MVFSGVVWSTSRLHANTVKSGYCLSIVTIALRHTLAGHFFTFADGLQLRERAEWFWRLERSSPLMSRSCIMGPRLPTRMTPNELNVS